MKALSRLLGKVENAISVFLLISTTAILFINIVLRYFFGKGFSWAEEFIAYAMIWATFLGASICVREKAHVAMTLILDSIESEKVKRVYKTILSAIAILFCLWFFFLGIKEVIFLQETAQTSPAMQIPMYVPYLAIPIGFSLMVLRFAEELAINLRGGD